METGSVPCVSAVHISHGHLDPACVTIQSHMHCEAAPERFLFTRGEAAIGHSCKVLLLSWLGNNLHVNALFH